MHFKSEKCYNVHFQEHLRLGLEISFPARIKNSASSWKPFRRVTNFQREKNCVLAENQYFSLGRLRFQREVDIHSWHWKIMLEMWLEILISSKNMQSIFIWGI